MRAPLAAVVCMLLCLAGAHPCCAQPVAIVTEVDGPVRIVAQGRQVRPEVADQVEQGATVVVERDARVVLAYPGIGSIYELQGPGRFVARSDAVQSQDASGRLARRDLVSALRALRIRPEGTALQGSAAMRGASALDLQATGPTGSQLERDAIRLCWKSLGERWMYRVRVIDDDGTAVFDTRTAGSSLELPATLRLQANAPYLWHVLARGPNGQSAEAAGQFRRLDAASEQALLRAESALAGAGATDRALYRIARDQLGFAPAGAPACARSGGS
jgi:hypothetical protein